MANFTTLLRYVLKQVIFNIEILLKIAQIARLLLEGTFASPCNQLFSYLACWQIIESSNFFVIDMVEWVVALYFLLYDVPNAMDSPRTHD